MEWASLCFFLQIFSNFPNDDPQYPLTFNRSQNALLKYPITKKMDNAQLETGGIVLDQF